MQFYDNKAKWLYKWDRVGGFVKARLGYYVAYPIWKILGIVNPNFKSAYNKNDFHRIMWHIQLQRKLKKL